METATRPDTRWTLRPCPDEAAIGPLSEALNGLPEALARILLLRGVDSFDQARHFFRGGIEGLHDPFLMADMDKAAERLAHAIETGERVLVYGDYDVDGTTSTALMTLFLRAHGVEASFFIPHRFRHGYGLSPAGLDEAKARGATLVVALDCGITAIEEAEYAKSLGIDLVICDHHTAGEILPNAIAVLDPKRPDCGYPFDGLSGCGVGFKLLQATLHTLGLPPEEAWPFLDLVAVSTASDIVPLIDENRLLMRAGIQRLCTAPRPGIAALARQANVDLTACNSSQIVFNLGPRINAAGRMDDATLAAELLMAEDRAQADPLADAIERLNAQRRDLDRQTRDEALALAEAHLAADPDAVALVLHNPDWHGGVIGITASRVAETFHRPSVLLTAGKNGLAKGSARSVKGLSIYAALAQCEDLLERFGGHAFAAGLALPTENVGALRARLNAAIAEALEHPDDLVPEIELDAELDLTAVDGRFWRVLDQFRPFGPDNPKPVFWSRDLRILGQPTTVGADGKHLKMRVVQRAGSTPFSVIGFGLGEKLPTALASVRRGQPLELAFTLEENTWNGRTTLQLRAKDVRLEEPLAQ